MYPTAPRKFSLSRRALTFSEYADRRFTRQTQNGIPVERPLIFMLVVFAAHKLRDQPS